jgi:cytochrome c-type protein NapC
MPTAAILILIVFSAMLAGVLVLRPAITIHPGGKILAFGVFFFLPVFCLMAGMDSEMQRSKSTAFCLSCHIMQPYGKSLARGRCGVPCRGALPKPSRSRGSVVLHVPHELCDVRNIQGKDGRPRHLYVHYLRTEPLPGNIPLHEPYNNRECLHCHLGARSF